MSIEAAVTSAHPAERARPASTPRQGADVRRFLMTAVCFVLPPLVLFGFPALILMLTGELLPLNSVDRLQQNTSKLVLYGPAVTGPDGAYKLIATLNRKPRILALGSSRVMALRSKFFRDSAGFYNAGGAVSGFRHFRQFLENIPPGQEPNLAVLCFEQHYFNAHAGEAMRHDYQEWLHWKADRPKIVVNGIRDTYRKIVVERKFTISEMFPVPFTEHYTFGQVMKTVSGMDRIGMNAIVNENGYRNDGSYYYGKYIKNPKATDHWDYHFKDTISRIDSGSRAFQFGDDVWQESLDEIDALLQYCRQRGIHVVGFLPPYAPTVRDHMRRTGKYAYLDKIIPAAEPVFRRHGMQLFDFTDMRAFGSSDAETIDGWHASEKAYLRAFVIMAERDQILRREVDLSYLHTRLAQAEGPYQVFGLDEY
jgi:hypothetical protein